MEKSWGIINHIQRMCTNDGPGFRTTVFCKGCLLDCLWCHNPEGKHRYPQVIPHTLNCTGCGDCQAVCPTGALRFSDQGVASIDRGLCTDCLQCAAACPREGLVVWGRIAGVAEVMAEVEADLAFYQNSGGGLTVSGGEPMAQPEFVRALFSACKAPQNPAKRISTALDTCGHAPWESYEKVLPLADLVLLDIKHMDPVAHKDYTGADNTRVLDNARRMAKAGQALRIRVPVIPGINDTQENWQQTARFCESLGQAVTGVDLLPYHPFAGGKYKVFGMDYDFPAGQGYDDERLLPVVNFFLDHTSEVTIGG